MCQVRINSFADKLNNNGGGQTISATLVVRTQGQDHLLKKDTLIEINQNKFYKLKSDLTNPKEISDFKKALDSVVKNHTFDLTDFRKCTGINISFNSSKYQSMPKENNVIDPLDITGNNVMGKFLNKDVLIVSDDFDVKTLKSKGNWIQQKDIQTFTEIIGAIRLDQSNIKINSNDDNVFKEKIISNLETLLTGPTGRALLQKLHTAQPPVTIEKQTPEDVLNGKPNEYSNTGVISINPNMSDIEMAVYDDNGKKINMPSYVTLGHELVHALHDREIINAKNETALNRDINDKNISHKEYDNLEEERTIRPKEVELVSEESIRIEHGLKIRFGHSGVNFVDANKVQVQNNLDTIKQKIDAIKSKNPSTLRDELPEIRTEITTLIQQQGLNKKEIDSLQSYINFEVGKVIFDKAKSEANPDIKESLLTFAETDCFDKIHQTRLMNLDIFSYKSECNYLLGVIKFDSGKFDEADTLLKKSLDLSKKSRNEVSFTQDLKICQAKTYNGLAGTNKNLGNYDKALEYLTEAKKLTPNLQGLDKSIIDTCNVFLSSLKDNFSANLNTSLSNCKKVSDIMLTVQDFSQQGNIGDNLKDLAWMCLNRGQANETSGEIAKSLLERANSMDISVKPTVASVIEKFNTIKNIYDGEGDVKYTAPLNGINQILEPIKAKVNLDGNDKITIKQALDTLIKSSLMEYDSLSKDVEENSKIVTKNFDKITSSLVFDLLRLST